MRDINDRVGHYLFSLAVIYAGVAACSTVALAVLGFPNAIIWGVLMGIAGFVPFIGSAVTIAVVALVAMITFDDWPRIIGAPAALLVIHVIEANFVTPMFVSRRCASTPWRCSRPSPCSAGCGARSAPLSRCRC